MFSDSSSSSRSSGSQIWSSELPLGPLPAGRLPARIWPRLKKHEPQLQADGTRFNLFYSADGCNGASQIHFCDAKIGIILKTCKFTTTFLLFY
jgi:hypothetical protein